MTGLSVTLTGAQVLGPAGVAVGSLSLHGGRITDASQTRRIDLTGCAIRPGLVDLHGDGFERHLAPRRGLVGDLRRGLLALDAELAACGITTAVLAQFWSWEGGMRGPDFARTVAAALQAVRPQLLTDMHLQLRLETHLIHEFDAVAAFVAEAGIGYLCFNDHLPHAALAAGKRPPRLAGQAVKSRRSPETHLALMHDLHARGALVSPALDALAARLQAAGVQLASHDDANPAVRAAMRTRGVAIAEFPETAATAAAAKASGDVVILGAPNVVRGGSHAGKMDARVAVADGLCDALVSDYHYPSLAQAAEVLAEGGDVAAAWALVSTGPARVLGWDDRGALRPGARADMVILGPTGRIEATFCAGRVAFATGTVAARLFDA